MRHWLPLITALSLSALHAESLEESFANPPASARPHTWWHWMNGNVTKEGITLDLEAMARIGIGGAQIFNVGDNDSCNIPKGPVDYMSPMFLDLVKHAATEAKRLGIEICMHNCPGWSSSGGPWIDPAHSMQLLVSSEVQAGAGDAVRIPQPETRRGFYQDIAALAFPTPKDAAYRIPDLSSLTSAALRYNPSTAAIPAPAAAVSEPGKVIDLTNKLKPDGSLDWTPPSDGWTVVRFGHTTSGKTNHPASPSGIGLECDKLSREAMDLHWNKGIQPVLDHLGPVGTHALNNLLVDSYEVGPNTWTPKFREEFRKRRGYDMQPYLPVLAGHVIADGETSARFLWDYRRTIADLFADNYYAYFAERCHKAGLLASVEPYDGPFECLANGRGYDITMGEFWTNISEPDPDYPWASTINHSCKVASSVAHVNGRNIVGAESFTSGPPSGRWQNYPGLLKQLGDAVWCLGVNRYIFHRYAHQPWSPEIVPGMTMGQWGTHFDRTNTWWEPSREWMRYIARSQFLLQQGRFSANVLFFGGENAPAGGINRPGLKSAGHDYDAAGTDLIDQLSVENGELVLPGGMRYKLLVLPDEETMTPKLVAKLRSLVEAGASLLGGKPLRSPGLHQSGFGDNADALWGNPPAGAGAIRKVGKGTVLSGVSVEEAVELLGIRPQVVAPSRIHWIQRITPDHKICFLSNQSSQPFEGEITFPGGGSAVSLLDPMTGESSPAPVLRQTKGSTSVTLSLPAEGSVFVLLGNDGAARPAFASHVYQTLSPAPDEPEAVRRLVIRKARYGVFGSTFARSVDVTAPLRGAMDSGALEITANNQIADDPAVLTPKSLFVKYTAAGATRTARVREGSKLKLPAAGESGPVEIIGALYGDLPEHLLDLPRVAEEDVTAKVAAMVRDGHLSVVADNALTGKDPLYGVPKELEISYTLDGVEGTAHARENQRIVLPTRSWQRLPLIPRLRGDGTLLSFAKERHVLTKSDTGESVVETAAPAEPVRLTGPWQVSFQSKRGAPATATFDRLIPLNEHSDPGIRYFSGTAVWKTNFDLAEVPRGSAMFLDLGRVEVIAAIKLNGQDLGILWNDPFRLDVTRFLKPGSNTLEVSVTNLWVNRLIGDEQFPPDVEWAGKPLAIWPDWFANQRPRPTKERITFTTWHHWTKDDALKPSGLIGPVLLRHATVTKLPR
jgi:hypothetical protein